MPKFYSCIVCNKRVSPKYRRFLKEVKYAALRENISVLLDKTVSENDCICDKCHKRYSRGKLGEVAQNEMKVTTFYLGTKCCKYCAVCGMKRKSLRRIPQVARTDVFLKHNVILYDNARACHVHFADKNYLKNCDLQKYSFRFKRGTTSLTSNELLQQLSRCREILMKNNNSRIDFENRDFLNKDDYVSLTGLTPDQFDDLCLQVGSFKTRKISKRTALGILLTKLRTGLSSNLLKTLFNITDKCCVCRIVKRARNVLLRHFVPKHLGFDHISRQNVLRNHTTVFARELLASGDHNTAILLIDGTYIYIQKSSKYTFQRKSYSVYKGRPLVKPMMIVASDGYIIEILGPYLADGKNNDAAILNKHLLEGEGGILEWARENDILVLDRGFRDSLDVIKSAGLQSESPYFLGRGQKQHSVKEANLSRLVTKIRWAVESANGRLKRWQFLANVVTNSQIPYIGDYVRIVAALINAFRPPLASDSVNDHQIAKTMLTKSKITVNPLKERFIKDTGRRATGIKMTKVDARDAAPDFPHLSEEYLRSLTFGIYQLKQASSYSAEHLDEDGAYDIFVGKDVPGILQAKIQSRHVSSKCHYLWIQYDASDAEDPVKLWYCQCRSGARLVGSCAHVASVLWFIGMQRYKESIVPSLMPSNILDCDSTSK